MYIIVDKYQMKAKNVYIEAKSRKKDAIRLQKAFTENYTSLNPHRIFKLNFTKLTMEEV